MPSDRPFNAESYPSHLLSKHTAIMAVQRDVEFKTSDGNILRGWFFTPSNQSSKAPCVILSHGVTTPEDQN
jgi:cephalosporin-C deacetylase-like acetyl esterase